WLHDVAVGVQRQNLRHERGRRHLRDPGRPGVQGARQEFAWRDDAGDARGVARQPDHPDGVEALPSRQKTGLMRPFDFQLRTRVVFGDGAFARLGELARELSFTRALLVADRGIVATGQVERAAALLDAQGVRPFTFHDFDANPDSRMVDAGRAVAASCRVDSIVAVGGGSSLDCAKGINFVLTNGGTMRDYKGFGKATRPMLPSVGVPTTAGTGSEAQSYALITDEKTHLKMACGDKKSAFRIAILDPEVTLSQPGPVAGFPGSDAIAHAIEAFVCTKRNPISNMCALAAFRYLEPNLETVLRSPNDLPSRSAMQVGAHLAGMAIENAMLGVCHSCANPLTSHYGVTH